MKLKGWAHSLLAAFSLLWCETHGQAAQLMPTDLRCEDLTCPVGIDVLQPRLSWRLDAVPAEARGLRQEAYQILAASSPDLLVKNQGNLWDSEKVSSDNSVNIPFGGKPLASAQEVFWKVRMWDKDGEASEWSQPASWTMGFPRPEDWKAKWIIPQPPDGDTLVIANATGPGPTEEPYLRRVFTLEDVPQSAVARVNVMGWFELYVNGVKVSADVLNPAVTDYSKRSLYLTYDLKPYLHQGTNAIGLWVSRGWYWPKRPGVVHDRPLVRMQVDIIAGSKSFMVGTDQSWQCQSSGRSVTGHWGFANYGGERVDARRDLPGWSSPEFKADGWFAVREVPDPGIPSMAQTSPPDRVVKTFPAVVCRDRGKGTYTLDFGSTLTGWLEMKLPRLDAGQMVTIRYSDQVEADEVFNQRDQFISAGKPGEVFRNKFNYHGFRYVTLEGLTLAPVLTDVRGLAIAGDWATTGTFECSNPVINQMHAVNLWTIRCLTMGGYMADCPHRERFGYGDGQNALESCLMNFDLPSFYEKWQADWRDVQKPDGTIPNTAPHGNGGGGPAWGGMLQEMAWRRYVYYGDRRALTENYDACQRYIALLHSKKKEGLYRAFAGGWNDLGDWVEPTPWELLQSPKPPMRTDPSREEADFFNNCYLVHLTDQLASTAKVLGRAHDASMLATQVDELRKQIHQAYFQPERNLYLNAKQAYLVMPLMARVVPENLRPAVNGTLKKSILDKNRGHLNTGSTATGFLMRYLQETGGSDLIWTMVMQKTYPGFGYMLDQGATTWWEQWEGGPSRIHSCFLSLDAWFYQGLAGIRPDPAEPGFKKIVIQPAIVGDLSWVKAHYDSIHGRIVSEWTRKENQMVVHVAIPPNTTATVFIPAASAASVRESGIPAAQSPGVRFVRMADGAAVFAVPSGTYVFNSAL